ncbi:conjugative transposon protein TraM [Phocaeicola massiliensis]|uniref:conjugative transposon protein TraM n=1 Tax=Phocaeicola massiliensis TaxID=204516 RepID=UPI00202EAE36|nr:conjugative transposon protein TraM [Phocaeicola massiliensis]MCM1613908.1 conjugative transposon protein TraM [Phocaeicola massiliensis]MCM1705895.1 conjugative transposon protein TraM [Phocaeicola massiliensis]
MYMETKKEQKNETKEKKPLTEEQRQRRRKMLVYPLMGLTFLGCMWLIFSPSQEDREKERQGQGFNTDMPQPEDAGIIGDKAKAYEQQQLENRQKQRRGMVGDLSSLWHDGAEMPDTAAAPDECRLTPVATPRKETESRQHTGIRSSVTANERLNTSLGTFYEPPKEDDEKKKLRRRIDELERMVMEQEKKPSTMEEQVALLEKSYELAAKYQNGGGNAGQTARTDGTEMTESNAGEKKMKAEPVSGVHPSMMSALPQPLTDSAFIADYGGERNYGFHTAIGSTEASGKNTIAACVQGDQTVTDGQTVRLRLLEPMRVLGRTVSRNSTLVGTARLQGERLEIGITSLEHQGNIIPVELEVYDNDGQAGIFVPGSMETDAAKEIGANMGSSLGSSINISTDAGAQLASDLGKGVIQGVSQYISKRMRTVRVHLKSGYRVLLYQEKE